MELAPGVHQFDTDPFNWYVLEEAGRLTLVDAGFPGHYRAFRAGLAEIGREVKDVAAVVLTHAHLDHLGFARRVAREAQAPVMIHQHDVAAAGRILQLPWYGLVSRAWRPYTAYMLATATLNGVFTLNTIPNAVPFSDGQVLDVPGRPQVIHTPGHTVGEVSLLLEKQRVLITGDTLVTRNVYTGAGGQPQVTPPLVNQDYAQCYASLDRLADLGTLMMLTGHGPAWTGDMRDAVSIARDLRVRTGTR